jgi:hypothetical protein
MIERPMVAVLGFATVTSDTSMNITTHNPYCVISIKGIADLQCFDGKKVTMSLRVNE